ncbi:MAG: hypothetical protein AAGN46_00075 [Acidobacteriota bacterium]
MPSTISCFASLIASSGVQATGATDSFVYLHQTLIAGVLALVAGVLAYLSALSSERREKRWRKQREETAAAVFVVQLKVLEEQVSTSRELAGEFLVRLNENRFDRPPDDWEVVELPAMLTEPWHARIGLLQQAIFLMEDLRGDILSYNRAVEQLSELLSRSSSEDSRQAVLASIRKPPHDTIPQALASVERWSEEVEQSSTSLAQSLIDQFSLKIEERQ